MGITGKIQVTAYLEGDTLPTPVTRLYVDVVDRSGESIGGPISDDGRNGDQVAGDGIFTGTIAGVKSGPVVVDVRTDVPGFFRIVSTASC